MTTSSAPIQLKDVPLFQDLSERQLRELRRHIQEKDYDKGAVVFLEGEPCERILILQSGRLKVSRTSAAGKEQILEILEPGDTCACNPGSRAWFCTASAQTITPSRVWFLAREHYLRMVHSNSRLTRKLNRIFAERLCRFCSLIEEISLDEPDRRLAKFILELAVDQSGPAGDAAVAFTHEEISQRLGLVRETVTRHLQKMKRQGLIDVRPQRITIRNREALEKIGR